MMILISCAKTMASEFSAAVPGVTVPRFEDEARRNALEMARFTADDLGKMLGVSPKLAAENYLRYQDFFSPEGAKTPALLAYTGMVFKRINPKDFTTADFDYAQKHLLITSFLYGLLRPLDGVRMYRMEGSVRLPERGGKSMFDIWKPLLTEYLIESVNVRKGGLINLASAEMKELFGWKRVCGELDVITPDFYVYKNGRPVMVTVYAKMCRGEMTRFVLKNRINNIEALKTFEWEGFCFDEELSEEGHLAFSLR